MKEDKNRINMSVTPEFWKDWQAYAEEAGMSASAMFEFMGRALIRSKKGQLDIFDMFYQVGVEHGNSKSRGRKK